MKTQKFWSVALATLAALSLASCNDDDDDKVGETDTLRALFEMKKDYSGVLRYGLKGEGWRTAVEGVVATSAEDIRLAIPLEPVACQVKDEEIARKLREWQTADIRAVREFRRVEDEYFGFSLHTAMCPDERFFTDFTRTQPVEYGGLTLLFNDGYTGEYQKIGEALSFNVCIGNVLIGRVPLDGFEPVIYRYEGRANGRAADSH